MFRFERLDVWHKSIELADEIYRITRNFPDYERFALANQLRRAAVSDSSNLAEGSGRSSNKEYIRFVEIAYGSVMEVVSQVFIAQRQSFITDDEKCAISEMADEVAGMLSGLRAYLMKQN